MEDQPISPKTQEAVAILESLYSAGPFDAMTQKAFLDITKKSMEGNDLASPLIQCAIESLIRGLKVVRPEIQEKFKQAITFLSYPHFKPNLPPDQKHAGFLASRALISSLNQVIQRPMDILISAVQIQEALPAKDNFTDTFRKHMVSGVDNFINALSENGKPLRRQLTPRQINSWIFWFVKGIIDYASVSKPKIDQATTLPKVFCPNQERTYSYDAETDILFVSDINGTSQITDFKKFSQDTKKYIKQDNVQQLLEEQSRTLAEIRKRVFEDEPQPKRIHKE